MFTLAPKHILLALCVVLMLGASVSGQRNPITKKNLLESLKIGGVSANEYSELIRNHGVDFRLTPDDEREIRRAGKHLGKKGLDQIIAAVRGSYIFSAKTAEIGKPSDTTRPVYQQPPSAPPQGSLSNSNIPGRQSGLFVQVFTVKIAVSVKQESAKEIQGLHDTSAYLIIGEQTLKLTPDPNTTIENRGSGTSVVTVRYVLDSPNPIVGKPIFFLSMIGRLNVNYSTVFRTGKLAPTKSSSGFELSLIINDQEYSFETPTLTQDMLASGEVSLDIHEPLTAIISELVKRTISKVTITSVSPSRLERSRGAIIPITIRGDGFQQGLMLFLICKNGPTMIMGPGGGGLGQIVKMSPTEVMVTINNYMGFSGPCQLSVQNPDGGRSNSTDFTFSP